MFNEFKKSTRKHEKETLFFQGFFLVSEQLFEHKNNNNQHIMHQNNYVKMDELSINQLMSLQVIKLTPGFAFCTGKAAPSCLLFAGYLCSLPVHRFIYNKHNNRKWNFLKLEVYKTSFSNRRKLVFPI